MPRRDPDDDLAADLAQIVDPALRHLFYHYLGDHLSGTPRLSALADLITERAAMLNLGGSWTTHTPPTDC